MVEMLDEIQNQLIGNKFTRLAKRITRIKTKRKNSADLRGHGVAKFIDHYVDPEHRGNDAARTASVLAEIAQLPRFKNHKSD
jgi:4-aminobutyrate aminotransferase-like enzyme